MLLCVELSKFASSQELIPQINCCISVWPTGVLECCLQISSIVFLWSVVPNSRFHHLRKDCALDPMCQWSAE